MDKGIGKFFGTMEENERKGIVRGLEYIDKELSAGREVIFKKKHTIDLMRGNPLYDIVDLPDGSIKVLKINQEARDIFEGKAVPSSPEGNALPAKAGRSKKTFDQIAAEERLQEEVDRVAELGLSNEKVKKLSKVLPAVRAALEESRRARAAGREGQGLNPDVTIEQRIDAADMRDPVISESKGVPNPRGMRRMPKTVVVGGRAIELPEDYGQRKKFRQYRHQEVERARDELAAIRDRRPGQDQQTAEQLRGTLGRAGRRAGLAVGGAVKGLPKIPLPSARNPLVRFGLRYNKNIGGMRGGLAGLGALAGGALVGKLIQSGVESSEIEQQRMEDLRRSARRDMLDLLGRKEHKQALQMNINDNLAQLQAQAPDLYMSVAAGRRLPQGAVVIGGVPRQDLLQQLGMSMSNGDFNQ